MYLNSIIIINYNNANLTIQTIESINKFKNNGSYEIIVIDNASEIIDFEILKIYVDQNPKLKVNLYRSKLNVGFGAGNMLGVNLAKGKYYTFVNNDVIITQPTFDVLTNYLENNADVAIVGCQAVDENNNKYKAFDYKLSLTTELLSDGFLHFFNKNKYPKRKTTFKQPTIVGAVPGSLFCCSANDFSKVGGFDSTLFLYYEEKDLGYRINKQLNKKIVSINDLSYIHLKGKSTKKSIDISKELKIAQFYTIRKNLGFFKYSIFYIVKFFIFLLKSPFSKKNFSYLKLILIGFPTHKSLKYKQQILAL